MKWTTLTLAAVLGCGAMLAGCEKAQDQTVPVTPGGNAPTPADVAPPDLVPSTSPSATTKPTTQASASLSIVNKFCAIETENKIDPDVTVAYNGKTIGFCCKDCIPKFQADPAKYMATLK